MHNNYTGNYILLSSTLRLLTFLFDILHTLQTGSTDDI